MEVIHKRNPFLWVSGYYEIPASSILATVGTSRELYGHHKDGSFHWSVSLIGEENHPLWGQQEGQAETMIEAKQAAEDFLKRITSMVANCIKCNQRPVYVTTKGVVGKLCPQCFIAALSELPNPDCEFCLGEGEYYWHSEDCNNDLCALAGGYDDCNGMMVNCDCSIFDE